MNFFKFVFFPNFMNFFKICELFLNSCYFLKRLWIFLEVNSQPTSSERVEQATKRVSFALLGQPVKRLVQAPTQ